MEYNPGTGFLTDDSGLVLSYHRRADLRPVGRLLVTSPEKLLVTSSPEKMLVTSPEQQPDAASLLVTSSLEKLPQAAAASLLCTSSCLSSQVSEKDLLSLHETPASGVLGQCDQFILMGKPND